MWRGNKRILFQVFSIQKITDMLSSNQSLSLYTKLMTALNKEDWQSMHEIKNYESPLKIPFYHSIHLFEGTTMNKLYRMIRMGAASHVRSNGSDLGWHF